MNRDLVDCECNLLGAACFRQDKSVPLMDRYPPAQVWQPEGGLTIATVRGADELEQSFVFRDWQKLSFTEHPACRGKVARKHSDLADIGLCHGFLSLVLAGEDAL